MQHLKHTYMKKLLPFIWNLNVTGHPVFYLATQSPGNAGGPPGLRVSAVQKACFCANTCPGISKMFPVSNVLPRGVMGYAFGRKTFLMTVSNHYSWV